MIEHLVFLGLDALTHTGEAELPLRPRSSIHPDLVGPLQERVNVCLRQAEEQELEGNLPEASRLLQQVVEDQERLHGIDHPEVAGTLHELARVYLLHGEPERAEPILRGLAGRERNIPGARVSPPA